ncbi:MAG: AAA family ATPase [Pseudomonadota bacterium]
MSSASFYIEFFGFTERPFTLVPDPAFLYWSKQHKQAYSVLDFGVLSVAPITLVTGEIGAGKTTLLQAMLKELDGNVTVGLISNAQGGRGELLQWILNALGLTLDAETNYVLMFQKLQDFLLAEYAAGRRVLLIIDEAQNLSTEGLEELRMLTNINAGKDVLVQLLLVGQPELRDMVQRPALQQLAQRVAASFHLTAMDAETVADYIAHRLRKAGGTGSEFTAAAAARIHAATRGVPRLINQLCEFALLYAWSGETRVIDAETIAQVLDDGVFFPGHQPPEEAQNEDAEDVVPAKEDAAKDDATRQKPLVLFQRDRR